MTKADMIQTVMQTCGVGRERARAAVEQLFDEIAGAAALGVPVTLPRLGTLSRRTTAARAGRNPRTGEALALPARHRVRFRAGKAMTARLAALTPHPTSSRAAE